VEQTEEVTPSQAAQIIRCSRELVYQMIRAGEVEFRTVRRRNRVRGKTWIKVSSLRQFLPSAWTILPDRPKAKRAG